MKTSSSENFRVAPQIPDHEMLRLIGKGSYGEVWLARSVTGAMRAVKVVQRSDFQHDKTFEREFEGIKKYEPISRSHPGVVEVLHIGRNLNAGFYYYVMELGDDQTRGSEIIPELYVARTLASDINQREHGRLGVDECVDAGANLADGLHYLHQRGLTHRDVKPSNIIFVEGVAKLADIGLVAASGQRTFVGTEGFVPPEGPGSPAADIYSLGMVLYEVSTGNDRLEFPELPNRLPEESERPKWRALNAVVCKACSQKPKDRYLFANDFAVALRRIKAGKVRRKTLRGKLFRTVMWAGLLAAAVMLARHRDFFQAMKDSRLMMASIENRSLPEQPAEVGPLVAKIPEDPIVDPPVEPIGDPPEKKTGTVKISSQPGVSVLTLDGKHVGEVDESGLRVFENIPVGEVSYILQRKGYASKTVSGFLAADEPLGLPGHLQVYSPPIDGETWTNSFEMEFAWLGNRHVARMPVSPDLVKEFNEDADAPLASYPATVAFSVADPKYAGPHPGVFVTREGAIEFCKWLTQVSRDAGYLTAQHSYVMNEFADWELVEAGDANGVEDPVLLMCAVEESAFGLATFTTTPPGAEIYLGEQRIGADGEQLRLDPGGQILSFRLAGHKTLTLEVESDPNAPLRKNVELVASRAAVLSKPWTNDLGMKFVPLGGGLLFGVHEVRVKDFRTYSDAEGLDWAHSPPFLQGDDHPVVMVTREQAVAFCAWLTEKDREEELLEDGFEYRLPSDLEWSLAAGLRGESGQEPAARDGQAKGFFPWGEEWPPPNGVGNLSPRLFDDGFANTAPVGSFPANDQGIHDLSGNVWEWVGERYGGRGSFKDYGVVRGGCFSNSREITLLASYRNPVQPGFVGVLYGFRVVVAKISTDTNE